MLNNIEYKKMEIKQEDLNVSKTFNKVSKHLEDIKINNETKLKVSLSDTQEVNLLLNNINPNAKKFESIENFCKKHNSFNLMETRLRRFVDYDKAAWEGKNAIEYDKDSKASKDLTHLLKEIVKLLGKGSN